MFRSTIDTPSQQHFSDVVQETHPLKNSRFLKVLHINFGEAGKSTATQERVVDQYFASTLWTTSVTTPRLAPTRFPISVNVIRHRHIPIVAVTTTGTLILVAALVTALEKCYRPLSAQFLFAITFYWSFLRKFENAKTRSSSVGTITELDWVCYESWLLRMRFASWLRRQSSHIAAPHAFANANKHAYDVAASRSVDAAMSRR